MRYSRSLPTALVLLLLLLILIASSSWSNHVKWTTTTIKLVQGMEIPDNKCTVHDRQGHHVSLHSWLIPKGIQYNDKDDELTCQDENSCRGFTIAHCHTVKCANSHACQSVNFTDNDSVECYRYAACQEAQFQNSHAIFCGVDSVNTCLQATMVTDKSVVCYGRQACVSDATTKITIRVGLQGLVRCTHGDDAYACQHMEIQVPHGGRACVSTTRAGLAFANCAVVCDQPGDCDQSTIQFRVVPERE
ncbi:hypothetical protein ACA910_011197 [Epithemia clementina (nom. ined.)]